MSLTLAEIEAKKKELDRLNNEVLRPRLERVLVDVTEIINVLQTGYELSSADRDAAHDLAQGLYRELTNVLRHSMTFMGRSAGLVVPEMVRQMIQATLEYLDARKESGGSDAPPAQD